MSKIVQRIRDPLHNLIEFDDTELERTLWQAIQTRPFQRLRRVKQLGFSDMVYPGATHSRLSHSVGVFHTARQLMKVIRNKYSDSGATSRELRALAAALLHDVGHGPFSHAFEKVGERLKLPLADHETISDKLIRGGEIAEVLNSMGSGFAEDVALIVKKEGRQTVHNAVVSSQFDADRLDYMRRDRLMTGSQHAAIDFTWLMANLELGFVPSGVDESQTDSIETFVIGPKAVLAAEAYVLGLFQLYPTVYFHKATRGAEKIFTELLVKAVELVKDGSAAKTGLPNSHPLVQFALEPDNLERVLNLDDTVLWGALPMMAEADEPLIRQFSDRLRCRKLFKCFDIRAAVVHSIDPDAIATDDTLEKIDRCCAAIKVKITDWLESEKSGIPSAIVDEARRPPYGRPAEWKDPAARINVRTDGNALLDLRQLSRVVASLKDFALFRAYYDSSNESARKTLEAISMGEIKRCQ